MLIIICNYNDKIPNPTVQKIIDKFMHDTSINIYNTSESLKSYLDDSIFKSGYAPDARHILIDYKDFPYIIEPITIPVNNNLYQIKNSRNTANILVGTRDQIKRYYEQSLNPEFIFTDSVSLNLNDPTSFIEFDMYELIRTSEPNIERSVAISHLSKKSCSMMENSSVISLASKISGYDSTDILNILLATKESISISILEKIRESEGSLTYEDILVEVPAFGLSYIQDNNVMVGNLGKLTIEEQLQKLYEDAESAVSKAIARARVKMLHNETVFPKKVIL